MERKKFLGSLLPLGAAFTSMAAGSMIDDDPERITAIPPYLKKGDLIGITCPAGFISNEDIQPAVNKLKEWGFQVKVGETVGKKDGTLGGTDDERTRDLQRLLDDKIIKAVLCARGGYGAVRIIDALDFTRFVQHPKWIIGFSDATVLHCHLNRNFGIASIHSKMCNSFPADWDGAEQVQRDTIDSIRKCLTGETMQYNVAPNVTNRPGKAAGALVGGNLKTIETLAGSKSDLNTNGKILFVEDTGEYLYSIDRMFWNLQRTGKLEKLKGLIIGGFKIKASEDPAEEFNKNLQEIVLEKVKKFSYPVCFDFPVGHQKNNVALKCGVKHLLSVTTTGCSLREIK